MKFAAGFIFVPCSFLSRRFPGPRAYVAEISLFVLFFVGADLSSLCPHYLRGFVEITCMIISEFEIESDFFLFKSGEKKSKKID